MKPLHLNRVSLLALALIVGLCTAGTPAAANTPPIPIKLATLNGDIAAQAYYAKDLGLFRKAGLDVQIAAFNGGAAMAAAVIGGSMDIGWSNTIALSTAREHGIALTILAPANMHVASAPTAGILAVLRSSAIHNAKDLAGKTVAVGGLHQLAEIATKAWIDQNGGDSKSVHYIEMPLSAMTAALESHRVDAVLIDAANYTTEGKPNDPLRSIGCAFDAIAPRFAASVWFASSNWVAAHPDAARAFVKVMRETAEWANAHHRESAEILARHMNVSAQQINSVRRVTYGEQITDDVVQPEIDVAAKYGLISSSIPATDLISNVARADAVR